MIHRKRDAYTHTHTKPPVTHDIMPMKKTPINPKTSVLSYRALFHALVGGLTE